LPKKTFEAVAKVKGELIVQIKGNQRELHREVEEACNYLSPISCYDDGLEKSRNRVEARTAEVFDVNSCLVESGDWNQYINCVVRVKRTTEIFDTKAKVWKVRSEVAHYAASHLHDANYFAEHIRQHWYTENCNHHVRDVSLFEDCSRVRKNAGIFARLRSFALNILRFNEVENVRAALFENALDFSGVIAMKGLLL
jgi:predicted transposase YbfD/YdcC